MIAIAKTKTSTEVKNRWNAKAYRRYTISLRNGEDDDIMKYIENNTDEDGKGVTKLFKTAIREKMKED